MRGRETLALMELAVMLLVFSLAAALCLRAFVWSVRKTEENRIRMHAALLAQTAAEELKVVGDAERRALLSDGNGKPDADGCCFLRFEPFHGELLGGAAITVEDGAGNGLFRLDVRWQESAA